MDVNTQDVLDKVLNMKESDRAFIAERLIASLETEVDSNVELAWQVEVQKRVSELDSGKVESIPWDEVKSQIKNELSVKH